MDSYPLLRYSHRCRLEYVEQVCWRYNIVMEDLQAEYRTAYQNGEYEKCLELTNVVLTDDPINFDALAQKGATLMRLNRNKDAIEVFSESIKVNNTAYHVWVFRGDCHYALADYEKAFSDYWVSLQLEPDNGAAVDRCARCLFHMGDTKEALKYIRKAAGIAESSEPMLVMIHMLKLMGFPSYAKEVYRMGLKKFPEESERFRVFLDREIEK